MPNPFTKINLKNITGGIGGNPYQLLNYGNTKQIYKSPTTGSITKIVSHIQNVTNANPPYISQNSFRSLYQRSFDP